MLESVEAEMKVFTPFSSLPEHEKNRLKKHLEEYPELVEKFDQPEYDQNGLLYCRQVTCPSCRAKTPLLNTCWLSKEAKDPWGVRIVTTGAGAGAGYDFETYQLAGGQGPHGEDPEIGTVKRGVGQCVHCKQAIEGDEIKAQARGESQHGQWRDELYAVVAVRFQPKLNKDGKLQYFSTGPRKGEIKTHKVRFFRSPNALDRKALHAAAEALREQWDDFDGQGLIPTEKFPRGNDMRPAIYGMDQWYKLFNDRQLLGHLASIAHCKNST